jgi:hypothetical protein
MAMTNINAQANEIREMTMDEIDCVSGGDAIASLKLLGELLSNISKTRSEISMTFARNARA